MTMKNLLIALSTLLIPIAGYSGSIRVDIDINIMNGDGTLTTGDKNKTAEDRNGSGSKREDASSNSKASSTETNIGSGTIKDSKD